LDKVSIESCSEGVLKSEPLVGLVPLGPGKAWGGQQS